MQPQAELGVQALPIFYNKRTEDELEGLNIHFSLIMLIGYKHEIEQPSMCYYQVDRVKEDSRLLKVTSVAMTVGGLASSTKGTVAFCKYLYLNEMMKLSFRNVFRN